MQEAVRFDHVCAEYKGDYRSIGNFARSDVVGMDIDNDHIEEPAEWITHEKLDELLFDISYVIAFSQNYMKLMDGKAASPKFQVNFQIIKDGSYATSLTYVEKLISIIERWNLTQYDAKDSGSEVIRWYRVRKT